jgi:hypothetical protein
MPVIMRALKVCSGASTKGFSRRVFYLRYATVNIMRSPVFDANAKKPPRNVRVPAHREKFKYSPLYNSPGNNIRE